MAVNNQGAKVGTTYKSPLERKITIGPRRVISLDISNWVLAVNSARDPNYPRRLLLYQLYESARLDAHLILVMEKRKTAITNQKIHWRPNDEKNTAAIEKMKEAVLNTQWFNEFISYAMDADPWGHSLTEFVMEKGKIARTDLLPRVNIMPELGFMFYNYFAQPVKSDNGSFADNIPIQAQDGIYYRDNPEFSPYLIEIGRPDDYGKLMSASLYVIYKRNGLGDWAQFAELFGMPFRVGEYDPWSPDTRSKLQQGLADMGSAAYAVVPKGSNIQFHDANGTGKSEVFKDLIELCNDEISKLFLGNTLTTQQGSKGARSLGQVHKQVEEDINVSDMLKMQYLLNGRFKEKIVALGLPAQDGTFYFPETSSIPLDKRIDIDKMLAVDMGLPMSQKYLYDTYGIDAPEDDEAIVVPPAPINNQPENEDNNNDDEPQNEGEKSGVKASANAKKSASQLSRNAKNMASRKHVLTLHSRLDSLYSHALRHIKLASGTSSATPDPSLTSIWDRITKDIHSGKLKVGEIDPELVKWTAGKLLEGVFKGYGSTIEDVPEESKDFEQLKALEEDVQVFSGFKTYETLREATDQLKDGQGNIKSFAQFKDDILKINSRYNNAYLQAEYQQAIAASQSNSEWVDIQAGKDTQPMLTYKTAGDDHVRPEHAILDDASYPVDDPFWDVYYPPIDWGCRCDVVQSDGDAAPLDKGDLPEVKDMFAINWGKEQVVFPDTHPYYDVSKAEEKDINDQLDNIFPEEE